MAVHNRGRWERKSIQATRKIVLLSFRRQSEHSLDSCSSAASFLLKLSWISVCLPKLPPSGPKESKIPCQPRMARCHLGTVPVDTAWPQGKPIFQAESPLVNIRCQCWVRRLPSCVFRSFQQTLKGETLDAVALGTSGAISHSQALMSVSFLGWQLTMQTHHALSRRF